MHTSHIGDQGDECDHSCDMALIARKCEEQVPWTFKLCKDNAFDF
jgi:hypothetical protein